MPRIMWTVLALLAGLLAVPLMAQSATADTGCPTASASYAGGAGTAVSPWQISTAGDLQKLRDDSITGWDDSFILTSNIDMGGCTWTMTIGNGSTAFTGLLDGSGFTVSGLSVAVAETMTSAYAGLVGQLGAPGKVTRIGFTGSVSASATTGSSKSAYAGGLVGLAAFGSTVTYSYATGAVSAYVSLGSPMSSAYSYAGGLIGRLDGTVTDSYATGSAAATGGTGDRFMYAGGLVGYSTSSVSRTYSTGAPSVTSPSLVALAGGFVGQTNGGTLTGNLWDVTSSGKSNGAGPATFSGMAGNTTAQMQQFSTYDDSAWAITNGWAAFNAPAAVWGICQGSTRAFLLWEYSANPCSTAPGAPTITSVSPGLTSVQWTFTVDDTGGASLTRLEFALDDTSVVDDSTASIGSSFSLAGLASDTTYVLYMRAVNSQGPGEWSAPTVFTTLAPPPPTPASPPAAVAAAARDAAASVTWLAPETSGTYGVTYYRATASPGGRTCLTSVTECTITGLTNGVTYTVTVQALTGAGWSSSSTPSNEVTPHREVTPTITITGTRGSGAERSRVTITGTSSGLAGATVRFWIALAGGAPAESMTTATVADDGSFTWSRKARRQITVYAEADDLRSNAVHLPGMR